MKETQYSSLPFHPDCNPFLLNLLQTPRPLPAAEFSLPPSLAGLARVKAVSQAEEPAQWGGRDCLTPLRPCPVCAADWLHACAHTQSYPSLHILQVSFF